MSDADLIELARDYRVIHTVPIPIFRSVRPF